VIPVCLRDQFPALAAHPEVTYLDSATTTVKPARVVDAVSGCLSKETASAGRGSHPWSNRLTREVERVREQVAGFVGADSVDEIVFTAGATAGLNAVALSWGLPNLRDGDEILFSPVDHSSTVAPWLHVQKLLQRFGIQITLVPYRMTAVGEIDVDDLRSKVTARTRLVVASHVHHVFGGLSTLDDLDPSIARCLDCSQSVGHADVDVRKLGADFVTFSGHKVFAAPGIGVLYCNRRRHDELDPFLPGGGSDVAMPALLEGGTPNAPALLSLGKALEFVDEVGVDNISEHVRQLTRLLVDRLSSVPRLDFLPGVAWNTCGAGYGIVSFGLDGVSASDVGFALSSRNFYVRTGNHCLPAGSDHEDSIRVSLHVYTTEQEVQRFADFVEHIAKGMI
jgi:cysteine desulfurase/selenocysteine lyase